MAEELSGLICVKCPKPAEYTGVDPKKAWYCRECFIQMVRNKFRSSISKKRIFNDENARDCLIVLEGTPASTFLLNQIDDALRQVNFKRLMIRPKIVLLLNSETRQEAEDFRPKIAEFQQILPENIEFILAHRAFSIDSSNSTSSNDFGLSNIEKYHEIVNSMKNTTYRLEFERILKEKCLRNLAKSTGIYKIMLADDADDLGRLTLAQLCLGRGGSLSSLVSVFDKRTSSSLIFIRPLREISKKEISLVNQLQEYKSIDFPANFSKIPNSSIQKLTDDFVNILEGEKFYSTINTVLSTAGKIHNLSENFKNICKFCEIENCSDCLCETCQQIQIDCSLLNLVQFS